MNREQASSLVASVINDRKYLKRLMMLEKERRRADPDELVFVGIHNVAQYRWCAEYSLLKSRANEMQFFHAYVGDRLQYALELGRLDQLPSGDEALLEVGSDLTLDDISALPDQLQPRDESPDADALSASESRFEHGVRVEKAYSEKYPTIEWNFQWHGYTLVGRPDGITTKFVYEFKSTSKPWLRFDGVAARQQADLYGYWFKRRRKRVQLRFKETGEIITDDDDVDNWRAEDVMKKFDALARGGPAELPDGRKCKSCEFRSACPVLPAQHRAPY